VVFFVVWFKEGFFRRKGGGGQASGRSPSGKFLVTIGRHTKKKGIGGFVVWIKKAVEALRGPSVSGRIENRSNTREEGERIKHQTSSSS